MLSHSRRWLGIFLIKKQLFLTLMRIYRSDYTSLWHVSHIPPYFFEKIRKKIIFHCRFFHAGTNYKGMNNIYEELPPENLSPCIKQRIAQLEKLRTKLEKSLQNAAEGRLRINASKKTPQYFHITRKGDTSGTYISKSRLHLAKSLCQRDYTHLLLEKTAVQLSALKEALAALQLPFLYLQLPPPRRRLISPVTLPDATFSTRWQSFAYTGKPFAEKQAVFISPGGIKVRSKSEHMIATFLENRKIPFRYEFPVTLSENQILWPDFYCLNLRTRTEFIWEHFGMMDNQQYAEKAAEKLRKYQKAGWIPGKNFIFTMETSRNPLKSEEITGAINEYLV